MSNNRDCCPDLVAGFVTHRLVASNSSRCDDPCCLGKVYHLHKIMHTQYVSGYLSVIIEGANYDNSSVDACYDTSQ